MWSRPVVQIDHSLVRCVLPRPSQVELRLTRTDTATMACGLPVRERTEAPPVFLNRREPETPARVRERGRKTQRQEPRPMEHATHATTHATTGATALLQPAQNTQTLHDSIRGTEHARARGIEDG
jgi:hypothetical protein